MTILTDFVNATHSGLPNVDASEVPDNCIVHHCSNLQSKLRLINTQNKGKIEFLKAHDNIPTESSYAARIASISAAYIHAHIKKESNAKLYLLRMRGTKYEIVRAVRNGIEVHRRLHEIGGFTCTVSPLNIFWSESGSFFFVEFENTHVAALSGFGEHLKNSFDHTPLSVPSLSPRLMQMISAPRLKDNMSKKGMQCIRVCIRWRERIF